MLSSQPVLLIPIFLLGIFLGDFAHAVRAKAYLGIPYAQPPVGNLRWRAPEPPLSTQKMLGKYPPPCFQSGSFSELTPLAGSSEDCLYLNIWAPGDVTPNSRLPVMFFIHGGGLMVGSSYSKDAFNGESNIYDGANLANRGQVIVVSIQYRLGLLGYLAHPLLSRETRYGGSGNYGLLDQIAALKWVNKHIKNYGGNEKNVTVFGESGGAAAVCAIYVSPLSQKYFARAISQSNGCPTYTQTEAEQRGTQQIKELLESKDLVSSCPQSCNPSDPEVFNCLRKLAPSCSSLIATPTRNMLDPEDFAHATYANSVDNYSLLESPYTTLNRGTLRKPLLLGTNALEGAGFTPLLATPQRIQNELVKYYGSENQKNINSMYPNLSLGRAIGILGDHALTCPSRRLAQSASRGANRGVFRYFFNYSVQNGSPVPGPYHAAELPFVFQNISSPAASKPTLSDLIVEHFFLKYWTQFAKTGNPNSSGQPTWSPYEAEKDNYLVLNSRPNPQFNLQGPQCNLFDRLRIPSNLPY